MPSNVSVVIPARNAATTLAETLESLLAQTNPNWQAIVVDDRSSDGTGAIAATYAARDRRFTVVEGEGTGVSRARNVGIAHAAAPWLLFLDADDWLTPNAVERLLARATVTDADVVYGAWIRVDASGRMTVRQYVEPLDDMFSLLAQQSCFAIHSCIARRDLVVAAGGFDEALVTCEEWDLWQRLARCGARFAGTNEDVALYRMAPGSLSMDAQQMLQDGFRVIAWGHGPDARVMYALPQHAPGLPAAAAAAPRLAYFAWTAALVIGAGGDATPLIPQLGQTPHPNADAARVAYGIFEAVPLASLRGLDAWAQLWVEHGPSIRALFNGLEVALQSPRFARRAEFALAALALPHIAERPFTMLRTTAVAVRADQPPTAITVLPGIERVLAQVAFEDEHLGNLELGVENGGVSAAVLRHAIADRFWWELLRFACRPHTWEAFLQSLWSAPREATDRFYADAIDVELAPRGAEPGAPAVPVEMTASLPRIDLRRGAWVLVRAGGHSVATIDIGPSSGSLDARRLRATITLAAGVELAKTVARVVILGWPAHDARSLGDRLRSREAGMVTDAARNGPVVVKGAAARASAPPPAPVPPTRAHGRHKWEGLFASGADPWRYTTAYETRKYEQTLALALPKRPRRALELACAEGHFTNVLAREVDHLVASDISAIALDRARARCAAHQNIEWRRIDMLADPLPSDMDLIVCSEVLYYVGTSADLEHVAGKIASALAPGGILVSAHANVVADGQLPAFDWEVPFGAATIGATLAATRGLRFIRELRTRYYRVQQFEATNRTGTVSPPLVETADAEPPPPRVAEGFRTTTVAPAPVQHDATTERLPILMYHRIAADGGERTAPYRVSSARFEEQLAYLQESGFTSATFEEWQVAASRRRALPGRRVMFTFDDAYEDFAAEAWPLLRRYGFGAVLFVVTDRVGSTNTWDAALGDVVPLLDWSALRRIAAEGVELGAHSTAHDPLTALSAREMREDLARARQTLRSNCGATPAAVAYPYGFVDDVVIAAAAQCGYRFGVTCRPGRARHSSPLLDLPRIEVVGGDSLPRFIARLEA